MLTASTASNVESADAARATLSDVTLVLDAQAGSLRARQQLFDRHLSRTRGFAGRLMGHDQEVNDVVQECMVSALESLGDLRNPKHFSSWLGGVLINTVRGTLVRRRRLTRFTLAPAQPIPIETLPSRSLLPDGEAELARFLRAVEQLPERLRAAWWLRHVERNTIGEIAQTLRCSPSTVKRWLRASRAQLGAVPTRARRRPGSNFR